MKFALSIIVLICFSNSIRAETLYQGVDISPMIEYYGKQVSILNQSLTTYNWSNRGGHDPTWNEWIRSFFKKTIPQKDPRYINHIREWSSVFWKKFGDRSYGNMYGYGLYLASDPRATFSYGGYDRYWRLVQIQIPIGMRILDLEVLRHIKQPPADDLLTKTIAIQTHFDCPQVLEPTMFFITGGGLLKSKLCQNLIKEVFDTQLKVDLLAYNYDSTVYNVCKSDRRLNERAFVVLRGDRINSENLRVYNAETTLNRPERIRIQTLMSSYPFDGYHIRQEGLVGVLWPDLDGENKMPGIEVEKWLLENKFGCSGKLPYAETGNTK